MSIGFLICYSRSGGTLLSKCLSSMKNVLVFSEIHPEYYSESSLKDQAKKWYNIDLNHNDFISNMKALYDYSLKNNLTLVIRDWSFVDFTPHQINDYSPAGYFRGYSQLKEELPIIPFALVRDCTDVWISRWKPEKFFEKYLFYVNKLQKLNCEIFKYEDLCNNSDKVIKEISALINVKYTEEYKEFYNKNYITGDTGNASRGNSKREIIKLQRKQLSKKEIDFLKNNPDFIQSNKKLGYPIDPEMMGFETAYPDFYLDIKNFINQFRFKKLRGIY